MGDGVRDGLRQPELFQQLRMRACDDVSADEFAHALRGLGAGFHRRFYAADVSADNDRHETAADLNLPSERDARCFDHGIAGFDGTDVAFGFHHSEGFTHVDFVES